MINLTSADLFKPLSIKQVKLNAKTTIQTEREFYFVSGAVVVVLCVLQFILNWFFASLVGGQNSTVATVILLIIEFVTLLLLSFPAVLGVVRAFWLKLNNAETSTNDIFYYYTTQKVYRYALCVGANLAFRIFIAFILCRLPGFLLNEVMSAEFFEQNALNMPYWIASLWFLPAAVATLGIIAFIMYGVRLLLVPVLVINNPALKPRAACRLSFDIIGPETKQWLIFLLSFFGWLLLGILILPAVYGFAYFLQSYVIYAKAQIERYNERIAFKDRFTI